jgi:SNF2 family DNA or RNA helicase
VEQRSEAGRYLVVVPASLLTHWQDEIARFSPGLRVSTYRGPFDERSAVWDKQARCTLR